MSFINLPANLGCISLQNVGSVAFSSAELSGENSIDIYSTDGFKAIVEVTGYPVLNAGLEFVDGVWCFAAELNIKDGMEGFAPSVIAFDIENQGAAQAIKTFLIQHRKQEGGV